MTAPALIWRIVAVALGALTAGAGTLHAGGGPGWAFVAALVAGGLVAVTDTEGTYAVAVAFVLLPVVVALATEGGAVAAVGLAAGAAATGEAIALARRASARAVADEAVDRADGAAAVAVVALTVVAGCAVVLVGRASGPDGVVGEVLALGAVVALGLLAAVTPAGRAALRSLLDRS